MTVENARKFIKRTTTSKQLRDQLNAAPDLDAIQELLRREGFLFSQAEFTEAYGNMLARSQSREQAELVKEIKAWWEFLLVAAKP